MTPTPEVVTVSKRAHNGERSPLAYVILTAARNEELYIEKTIRSVVSQTVRPVKWVILSDGSTDRTDEIVNLYAAQHNWITLLRMPERKDRQFAAKAHCVNTGYATIRALGFDVVANLDADVSFEADYFAFLLTQFREQPKLGVAGTPYVEEDHRAGEHSCSPKSADLSHVSGPCQVFRKACFEEVGGYVPLKTGNVDWVAVTTARMLGWQTRTFTDKTYFHHRKMGTAGCGLLKSHFRYGAKAYYVGGHPLWEFLRGISRMRARPIIVGGLWFLIGYFGAVLTCRRRHVSQALIRFHRHEQIDRLRRLVSGRLKLRNQSNSQ